jgi:hypothetical protein
LLLTAAARVHATEVAVQARDRSRGARHATEVAVQARAVELGAGERSVSTEHAGEEEHVISSRYHEDILYIGTRCNPFLRAKVAAPCTAQYIRLIVLNPITPPRRCALLAHRLRSWSSGALHLAAEHAQNARCCCRRARDVIAVHAMLNKSTHLLPSLKGTRPKSQCKLSRLATNRRAPGLPPARVNRRANRSGAWPWPLFPSATGTCPSR